MPDRPLQRHLPDRNPAGPGPRGRGAWRASNPAAPSRAWTARPTNCASARRATVEQIEELAAVDSAQPAQRAGCERKACAGPVAARPGHDRRFPIANVGANLPTLAATVSGNLYDLGEVTGLRLESHAAARGLPRAVRHAAPRRRRHARADRCGAGRRWSAPSSNPTSACRPQQTADAGRHSCARPGSTSSRTTRSAPTRRMRRWPNACRP